MFFLSFFFLVFVEISEISWGVVFIDFSCIPESGDMEVYLYQTESTVSFFFFQLEIPSLFSFFWCAVPLNESK